jgi:hypothetical protein
MPDSCLLRLDASVRAAWIGVNKAELAADAAGLEGVREDLAGMLWMLTEIQDSILSPNGAKWRRTVRPLGLDYLPTARFSEDIPF